MLPILVLSVLPAAVLMIAPGRSLAAGYSLYEQSGRALGFAGAFVARANDASSIFFNPAGLARLDHGEIYAGTSLIIVSREFAGTAPFPGYGVEESSPDKVFAPSTFYWGHPVTEDFGVGFGFYSPYGLSTEWDNPEQFSGRFISTKASITPFYFNPAAALEVTPGVRLGAGLMAIYSSVELNRHIGMANPADVGPDVLDLGTVSLNGDTGGLQFGFNLGLQLDLGDRVTVGANYRSGVNLDFDGDANFTFLGTGSPLDPQLQPLFPKDQKVKTALPMPAMFVGALAVQVSPKVSVEADLGWTQWSDFDVLKLRFEDPSLNSDVVEQWDDALFIRTGAEIVLNPTYDLRLGYYYDDTPQNTAEVSPLLPDAIRHGLSAGIGWKHERWRADLFGLLLLTPERSTDGINRNGYEGNYATATQITGVSVGLSY